MTANDRAWHTIFETLPIIDEVITTGYSDITAAQIKAIGKREARLMCKFDFEQKVAKPFKDNDLSILAISNGLYRIARTRPFLDVDLALIAETVIQPLTLPPFLETLEYDNITNESQALDAAQASGMLGALLGETPHLTVRGRRYSSNYDIKIQSADGKLVTYPISSVQFEVDGGYEGKTKLALIEAKMGAANNMNLRQLVYPHAHFTSTVTKGVSTYILFYEKGRIFTFIPLAYDDGIASLDYASVKRFQLTAPAAPAEEIAIPDNVINYDAPSPQANDFDKVLFGIAKLSELQPTSKDELFAEFAIHPRQYDYYFNAMRWLGLADRTGAGTCHLTHVGEALLEVSETQRIELLRQIMLTDSVFQGLELDAEYMANDNEMRRWKTNDTTFRRRRSTALAWLDATKSDNRLI